MQNKKLLLKYLRQGVGALLEQGCFDNGASFRPTQREALQTYQKYLNRRDLTVDQKLKGFFEIPTGVGKTAIFVAIVSAAHWAAKNGEHELKSIIVEPRNKLLYQTQESFAKFAPDFAESIGLYGDTHKDLKKPITIMTYNAWSKLSENDEISADNIDILISDEGHRGTSEGRIQTLTAVFSGVTGQLAFTATAHFDKTKSVQNSHQRQIFYKSLRDCWRDKEVSAYYALQYYEIRVDPLEVEEARKIPDFYVLNEIQLRQRVKQAAWNRRMLKVFREGWDEETHDLLSDNVSGFFVDDINHARNVEKMLNEDSVSQAKAKKLGFKHVAIAIHSKMPHAEKKKRFEMIENGECLAAVGDGMFKEGYDYPPMRNVFDFPRGSLVDKAQIIGRAGRKWRNPVKNRWEGTNIIDTIIYIGSDDPEEDQHLRKAAIRSAVLAEDVIEGPLALPRGKKREKEKEPRTKKEPLFTDDPNVKSYTTHESRRLLIGERGTLRKDSRISIAKEIWKKLLEYKNITGIAADDLLKSRKDIPEELNAHIINDWFRRKTSSANKDHIEYVLDLYEQLYSEGNYYIEIDESLQSKIAKYVELTGYGAKSLSKTIKERFEKLSLGSLQLLCDAKLKSVQRNHLDAFFSTCEYLIQTGQVLIAITPEIQAMLNRNHDRTRVGPKSLLQDASDIPEGLNPQMIVNWMHKNQKALKVYVEYVLQKWEALPDSKVEYVRLTDAIRNELVSLQARSGVTPYKLFTNAKNRPDDMKRYSSISHWLKNAQVARKDHLEWAIAEWNKYLAIKPAAFKAGGRTYDTPLPGLYY